MMDKLRILYLDFVSRGLVVPVRLGGYTGDIELLDEIVRLGESVQLVNGVLEILIWSTVTLYLNLESGQLYVIDTGSSTAYRIGSSKTDRVRIAKYYLHKVGADEGEVSGQLEKLVTVLGLSYEELVERVMTDLLGESVKELVGTDPISYVEYRSDGELDCRLYDRSTFRIYGSRYIGYLQYDTVRDACVREYARSLL